jgi:hypothetical protein
MTIATIEVQPRVSAVGFTNDRLSVTLLDGRVLLIPLDWYPRLEEGTESERHAWRIFEDSDGRDIILWESLDELIPVIALITGTPSRESKRSLESWLAERGGRKDLP